LTGGGSAAVTLLDLLKRAIDGDPSAFVVELCGVGRSRLQVKAQLTAQMLARDQAFMFPARMNIHFGGCSSEECTHPLACELVSA
jgi:hypothetical protein